MESDASETAGDCLDLAALVDRAERMVRGPRLDKGRRHEDSDSDYETQNWAASTSEPDMSHLRHAPGPRLRRRHAPGPRDWRHSLPECLEFYRAADTDGDSCADSVDSAALSDLWEHDSLLAETQARGNTGHCSWDYHYFLVQTVSFKCGLYSIPFILLYYYETIRFIDRFNYWTDAKKHI